LGLFVGLLVFIASPSVALGPAAALRAEEQVEKPAGAMRREGGDEILRRGGLLAAVLRRLFFLPLLGGSAVEVVGLTIAEKIGDNFLPR
jgi:hypothetical protein